MRNNIIYSVSLSPFLRPFSRWSLVSRGTRMSPFWILLALRMVVVEASEWLRERTEYVPQLWNWEITRKASDAAENLPWNYISGCSVLPLEIVMQDALNVILWTSADIFIADIFVVYVTCDQNATFLKFKMADGRNFENGLFSIYQPQFDRFWWNWYADDNFDFENGHTMKKQNFQ